MRPSRPPCPRCTRAACGRARARASQCRSPPEADEAEGLGRVQSQKTLTAVAEWSEFAPNHHAESNRVALDMIERGHQPLASSSRSRSSCDTARNHTIVYVRAKRGGREWWDVRPHHGSHPRRGRRDCCGSTQIFLNEGLPELPCRPLRRFSCPSHIGRARFAAGRGAAFWVCMSAVRC